MPGSSGSGGPPLALPRLFPVRQAVRGPRVDAIAAEVDRSLAALALGAEIEPGSCVAIAVGSRGITNLRAVVSAIVAHVRALGAEPFVVPAMGSHGGATAAAQESLLAGYGIDEAGVGCPVRSSMDVVEIDRSKLGFPLVFDRLAHEADHVVLCNRVKPHTLFTGPVESGLMKMWFIGLGKQRGAALAHRAIVQHGWMPVIEDVAPRLLEHTNVRAGVALVERGDDQTAEVAALRPERILLDEPALLDQARAWMARLPFDDIDVLLVDRIGKNISGAGLDTNVVGRKHDPSPPASRADATVGATAGPPGAAAPNVRYLVVRGLTPETAGNALGIGHAELCRTRVLRDMDVAVTRTNALTALDIAAAVLPFDYETDREILEVVLPMIGLRRPEEARILWIADTLHLHELWCSEALRAEAEVRTDLEVLEGSRPFAFDADGNLPDAIPPVP